MAEKTPSKADLQAEIERLHQDLAAAKSRAESAEALAEKKNLTVLEASKDLWRGTDENRPERPDTVAAGPKREGPSQTEVLEATVAKAMKQRSE